MRRPSRPPPCLTCKGGGYLKDRVKGRLFVCWVCDGFGVRGVAPVYTPSKRACLHSVGVI